jgi:hypothetical protein
MSRPTRRVSRRHNPAPGDWGGHPEYVVESRICLSHPNGKPSGPPLTLSTPAAAARFVRHIAESDQERSVVLALNAKDHLLAAFPVSIGGSRHAGRVEPIHLLKVPVLTGAVRVILAHNHPSGVPEASPADHRMARKRVALFRQLGVQVVDSLVIAREGFYSLLRDKAGRWAGPKPRRLLKAYPNARGGRFTRWPGVPGRVAREGAAISARRARAAGRAA